MEYKTYESVFKYLNTDYGNLVEYKTDKYPHHIFYMKGNKIVFDYNVRRKMVFISPELYRLLESFFNFDFNEIQSLFTSFVRIKYNKESLYLVDDSIISRLRWEDI